MARRSAKRDQCPRDGRAGRSVVPGQLCFSSRKGEAFCASPGPVARDLVPAAAPEAAEEESEDDQDQSEPEAPEDQDDDPDDDKDCAYAHELPLSLEIAPEGLFPFDCLE